MNDPLVDAEDDAATPLAPEERDGLIPSYITQRRELNEAEQIGIANADRWAFTRKRGDILDEVFLCRLHKQMFGTVWRWAGHYSKAVNRKIGLDHWQIASALRQMLSDVRYWVEHKTYRPDEIAVRFHHRLVQIHPFPNGNGRLSRLAADLLIIQLGADRFSWGRGNLIAIDDLRRSYIDALRAADREEIAPLLRFARS